MANISQKEFWEFLTEAELKTWASGNSKYKVEAPTIVGAKQYSYVRGNWQYIDTFLTSENKREFWGFEIVYLIDNQEKECKAVMIRQYSGKLIDVVDLEKADMLYAHLRDFRKKWLELPLAERQQRVMLQNNPQEDPEEDARKAISMAYRRLTLADTEGPYQEETLEVASVTILRHQFRIVMMAELAP